MLMKNTTLCTHGHNAVRLDLHDGLCQMAEAHIGRSTTAQPQASGMLHADRISPQEITNREGLPLTTAVRDIGNVALAELSEEGAEQMARAAVTARPSSPEYCPQRPGAPSSVILVRAPASPDPSIAGYSRASS